MNLLILSNLTKRRYGLIHQTFPKGSRFAYMGRLFSVTDHLSPLMGQKALVADYVDSHGVFRKWTFNLSTMEAILDQQKAEREEEEANQSEDDDERTLFRTSFRTLSKHEEPTDDE